MEQAVDGNEIKLYDVLRFGEKVGYKCEPDVVDRYDYFLGLSAHLIYFDYYSLASCDEIAELRADLIEWLEDRRCNRGREALRATEAATDNGWHTYV